MSPTLTVTPEPRIRHELQDVRHLPPVKQREILSEAEQAGRETVFLLRGYTRKALAERLEGTSLLLTDLDGTAAHGAYMDERALPVMRELQEEDVRITALTGRPYDEVEPLYRNHQGDPGFGQAIGEAGAYLFDHEHSDFLLANEHIEYTAATARDRMRIILTSVANDHDLLWQPMGFGGHRSSGAWQFMQQGKRVGDTTLHHRLIEDVTAQAINQLPGVRVLSCGTGAVEIGVSPEIHKANAIRVYAERMNISMTKIAFAGDSGNDLDAFGMPEDTLKLVVFGSHTPQAIVERAHIATVGSGNAAPLLRYMLSMRRQAVALV
jgi:HAD superfamily hydrolase (TIGR01484 family)